MADASSALAHPIASPAARRLIDAVLRHVARREAAVTFSDIKKLSRTVDPARDGMSALLEPGCGVIAEIKRWGSSRQSIGLVDGRDTIRQLAAGFEDAGVRIVACQAEAFRLRGSLEDLRAARQAVSVPVFCRDIIVDPYQVHEARFFGADLLPLQVEILDQARLEALADRTLDLGMTPVFEVRSTEHVDRAIAAGATVIAVNARPLSGETVDKALFSHISPGLPQSTVKLALSGVSTPRDLFDYASYGADAVVVGHQLMTASDPFATARTLVATGQHPACPSRKDER